MLSEMAKGIHHLAVSNAQSHLSRDMNCIQVFSMSTMHATASYITSVVGVSYCGDINVKVSVGDEHH